MVLHQDYIRFHRIMVSNKQKEGEHIRNIGLLDGVTKQGIVVNRISPGMTRGPSHEIKRDRMKYTCDRKGIRPMTKQLLSEPDGYALLKKMGVPVPDHGVATDRRSAEELATRLGFPVVMKILSPQVVHKTDAGG